MLSLCSVHIEKHNVYIHYERFHLFSADSFNMMIELYPDEGFRSIWKRDNKQPPPGIDVILCYTGLKD